MVTLHKNGTQAALLNEELCWRAAQARDQRFNGAFVLAVRTTGIYCRPTCPARMPLRANVVFFANPDAAERGGYRACKRCEPEKSPSYDAQVEMVRRTSEQIDSHLDDPLTLAQLGEAAGVSPHHLQRTFKRIMGISPSQYLRARRVVSLKEQLRDGETVTSALYGAGYGSSSRLYEGANAELGMTPATYRKGGAGMSIDYTIVDSPVGRLLVGATERGICSVSIGERDELLEEALHREYPAAEVQRTESNLGEWVGIILNHLAGQHPRLDLPVDVIATAFQRRVWEELRAIPYGATRTYGEIARAIGKPKAARAVGHACATNPVSIVVPCHRVIGGDGSLHGYAWGLERKRALLAQEQTATILVSDVAGSTALTERIGDAPARELLRANEQMLSQAIASHGGSVVKSLGDGLIASFSTASAALRFAVAAQRAIAEGPLSVRMGVNAGEPIVEDAPDGRADVFGTSVNLASRIAGAAGGGEILVSDVVRQLAAGKPFDFAERGETALRGYERPVRLFEVRWQE